MLYFKKYLMYTISISIAFEILCQPIRHITHRRWDWSIIDTNQISFPNNFLWGTAISEYQNSGALNTGISNWSKWESTNFKNNKPHIKNGQRSGKACDFWNRYNHDIQLMRKVGLNSLRFSVEWSRIEPVEGQFNADALEHYSNLCDNLIKAGITPLITLHHFTHPLWFEKKGGFEKEENIFFFVRFCQRVFQKLGNRVHMWCTINEPTIYVLQGYIRGAFPPGQTNMLLGLKVLKNLMQAHVCVYNALKSMPFGVEAQIGFIHQYLKFEAYSYWNILEHIPIFFLNYILNTAVLNFCASGRFSIHIPFIFTTQYNAPKKQKILDFFGLNYYSRVVIRLQLSLKEPMVSSHYPGEIMTDMPYAIYPEGLYNAISKISPIGVPIYITENGIADEKDNRRELFLKRYLYALSKAIEDGFDVRGYYYWSLMDNFEWDEGYSMKFGLYKVNFKTQERTLRQGARQYSKIIEANKNTFLNFNKNCN